MQPAALCEEVTRVFNPGATEVRALDGIDLTIPRGEMVAVAGPSGSGKTTLLNMLGCLDRPTSGQVTVDGEAIASMSRAQLAHLRNMKLGFVFQSFHLIPVLTVFENVEFALQIRGGMGAKERSDRIMPILETLGIAQLADRRPGEVSGGQQQRVAIARALVKKPVLILADEPTANLDSKTAGSIIELMVRLNSEDGVTFVLSTHDPMVMEAVPRLVKLRDGRVVEDLRQGGGDVPA